MSERNKLSEKDKRFHPYLTNKADGCGTLIPILIMAVVVVTIVFVII